MLNLLETMWQLIYRALKAEVKQFGLFILVKCPGGGEGLGR